jgi:endonuclease G
MRRRVSVFAGPIFDDENDPPYRLESRIPMRFWKIAVWADRSTLRSIALIGDQRKVLDRLTEGMPEAYLDEIELGKVCTTPATARVER